MASNPENQLDIFEASLDFHSGWNDWKKEI